LIDFASKFCGNFADFWVSSMVHGKFSTFNGFNALDSMQGTYTHNNALLSVYLLIIINSNIYMIFCDEIFGHHVEFWHGEKQR